MNTLCKQQQELSNKIAIAFIKKMYDPYMIGDSDFYWIAWDPTWTAEICDTYWSLSDMYEVLMSDYDKDDIWNWYFYTTENCWCDREWYLNLKSFCRFYKWYEWKLSEIYKKEIEKRNKNTAYWNSMEIWYKINQFQKWNEDPLTNILSKI